LLALPATVLVRIHANAGRSPNSLVAGVAPLPTDEGQCRTDKKMEAASPGDLFRANTSVMGTHRLTSETIDSETELRRLLGEPAAIVCAKVTNRLTALTRQFIERSPFVCLATADELGNCDVSPRGDPVGFVRILDEATLLVPERPGNRLADSLRNVLRNPHVGLLFVIPGVSDTFRVNGRATLTTDAALLAPSEVEGKVPKLGILVDIEQAYTQCSKAFLRSRLWDPAGFVDRAALPSNGELHRSIQGEGFDAANYDEERAARYARREGFY
jgi:PPOX class probable FMN-dependent enzyme